MVGEGSPEDPAPEPLRHSRHGLARRQREAAHAKTWIMAELRRLGLAESDGEGLSLAAIRVLFGLCVVAAAVVALAILTSGHPGWAAVVGVTAVPATFFGGIAVLERLL